jgi:outer membrane protein OmpA-like peptidoglycan-associated protein
VVTGCADGGRKSLQGTVSGNLLYATLVDNHTGIPGAMVLSVEEDGTLWGLRSDNGAPFRVYEGVADAEVDTSACFPDDTDSIGCESIVHGLHFGHDSADLLPASAPVLDALYRGLSADPAGHVSITGHTSSEGTEAYNEELSMRRAQAVVDALVDRGIERSRLGAAGRGEAEPIARNDTEAGRRLNRRVEVSCAAP